jgi:hypothetical protein
MDYAKPKVMIDMAEYQELLAQVNSIPIVDTLAADWKVVTRALKIISREDEDEKGNLIPATNWVDMQRIAEKTVEYINGRRDGNLLNDMLAVYE